MRISFRGESIGLAYTRDLCRDGMFLEIDPKGLRPNRIIEVRADGREKGHLLRAMVVHLAADGVGVCLLGGERDWYDALLEDLQRSALRPRSAAPAEAPGPGCPA